MRITVRMLQAAGAGAAFGGPPGPCLVVAFAGTGSAAASTGGPAGTPPSLYSDTMAVTHEVGAAVSNSSSGTPLRLAAAAPQWCTGAGKGEVIGEQPPPLLVTVAPVTVAMTVPTGAVYSAAACSL
jgi:hypothetical protein